LLFYTWTKASKVIYGAGVASLIECRDSIRKVRNPWFDSRCTSASLCPWEIYLMLFLILLWGQTVYPLWWPRLTNNMQTEQEAVLEWYDRHRA